MKKRHIIGVLVLVNLLLIFINVARTPKFQHLAYNVPLEAQVIASADLTPRIAYWYGKVNQHVNAQGVWQSDPDGKSGANIDKLIYCKKWYPNTISISNYKVEVVIGWRNGGNTGGPFTATIMSTQCNQLVLDPTPRIAYWLGKVNQHVGAAGNWFTDPDGVSGANLDKLNYCKKWFPTTTSVRDYKNETITTWRNGGNTGGPFTATAMTTECVIPIITCTINSFTVPTVLSTPLSYGPIFSWNTSNCKNVWEKNVYGDSSANGQSLALQGTNTGGTQFPFTSYDSTYDIALYATDGTNMVSVAKVIPVQKTPPASMKTCTIDSFTATPNPVTKSGSITFNWSSTNCPAVYLTRHTPTSMGGAVVGGYYKPTQTTATITNTGTAEVYDIVGLSSTSPTYIPTESESMKSIVIGVK